MTMAGLPDVPDINVPPPAPKHRGGMFGGGGKFGLKEALAYGLAGFMARRNPAILQGLMGMQMQRQQGEREEQQYQRHRQDNLTDYEAKQRIDAQYSTPQPTEYERLLAAAGIQPGTPEYQEHAGRFVGAKENPIVMTPYGPMPYSAVMGGGQQQAKPLTDEDILRMQGGPTPQASGGFPRPY